MSSRLLFWPSVDSFIHFQVRHAKLCDCWRYSRDVILELVSVEVWLRFINPHPINRNSCVADLCLGISPAAYYHASGERSLRMIVWEGPRFALRWLFSCAVHMTTRVYSNCELSDQTIVLDHSQPCDLGGQASAGSEVDRVWSHDIATVPSTNRLLRS